jgi:hypothetical protein
VFQSEEEIGMKWFASIIVPALLWVGPVFAQGRVSTEDFVKKVAISDMAEIKAVNSL